MLTGYSMVKRGGFMDLKNIKINTGKLKKTGIILASTVAIFYAVFLLVLPNVININTYKKDLQKIVTDSCNLKIDFENAKIVTSPPLSVGVNLTGLSISYPDDTALFKTDIAEAKVDILPLIAKTIKVSSIKVKTPEVTLDILSDDRLKIEKYLSENIKTQPAKEPTEDVKPLNFSIKLPKIKLSDYKVTFKDLKTSDTLAIAGEKLLVADVELNKRARIVTQGQVLLNDKKNISYDINIDTFLPDLAQMPEQEAQPTATQFKFNPVKAFKTYNLKANLSTKLKIRDGSFRDKDGVSIKGFLNAENVTLSLPNKTLPESYLKLNFKGQKVDIDSNLYVAQGENANIQGNVAYGQKQSIDLKVHTDKISVQNIQDIISGFLDSLGIKHEASKINSQGYLKADFNLKTNLKKIKSDGTIDVVNASFAHKTIPASIKNLNVNIDLTDDEINIKKCQAYLNDSLFEVLGHIDTDSHADINVVTKNLQIAKFYSAFAPKSLTDSITMKDGDLDLNVIIKDRLDKIKPEINLKLSNLALREKANNINISNESILTKLTVSPKGYNGSINSAGTFVSMTNLNIHIPNQEAIFDDKNIKITPYTVYINSSPITVSGDIKDYMKKCNININANGDIKTADIAKLLPREAKQLVSYSGKLPFKASLTGNPQKLLLNGHVQANANNHFSPITINRLLNSPSSAKMAIEVTNNKLTIKDLGIYDSNSKGVIKVTGSVSDLDKKVQRIDGIKLHLPKSLNMSTRAIKNSNFNVAGNLNISGTTLAPLMKGNIHITNVFLPDFMTKINSVIIAMHGESVNAKVDSANINGSLFNVNADAKLTPSRIFTISKMNLTSPFINADKLFVALDKIAKMTSPTSSGTSSAGGSSSASADIPVRILSGHAKIDKFKMGELIATNLSGNFNLHKNVVQIPSLSLNAYNGLITGSASYNIVTLAATANVKGSGIDANPALTAFLLVKDQVFGTAGFRANVSLKGATLEQQMRTLNGNVDFKVTDGQFGSLGKFENFLKAPNLLSQGFISTSIGYVINTVAPYNTGNFKYLKGRMTFANGVAHIKGIKSSGTNMGLYINGTFNLLNNNADMTILGRISSQVVGVLGPLSQLTTDKITKYIPTYGLQAMSIFKSITDKSTPDNLNKIPALTPSSPNTQEFKVRISGNIANPLSIRTFKWLSTASEVQSTQDVLSDIIQSKYGTRVVIPKTRQEAVQTVIQSKQVQEKIQQIQQNEKIQKLREFGDIIKQYSGQ